MALTMGKRNLGEASLEEVNSILEGNTRKIQRNDKDDYIRELESKIKQLQEENSNLKSLKAPVEQIEVTDSNDQLSTHLERFGKVIKLSTGANVYVGPSSINLFGSELNKMVNENETQPLEMIGNPYGLKLKEANLNVDFTFPNYSYCLLLVDTFSSYNDGCYYFFNEGLVKENLKRIFNDDLITLDYGSNLNTQTNTDQKFLESIWYCKLLLIFAIGEMYLETSNDENLLPGFLFFSQAQKLIQALYSSNVQNFTKEGSIEILLLYGFYLQVADLTVESYYYINLALDTCILLGYHVDINKESLNRFELEHKRRLFWTVYMFERKISTKQGLPISIADDEILTELPGDFVMSKPPINCENYNFPESEFISNCVKITQINSEILKNLYTKDSNNVLSSIQKLVIKLFKWKNTLPEDLFCDYSQRELNTNRLIVNLMTEYLQGFNLAVRPLLFNFVIHNIKIGNLKKGNYLILSNYSNIIVALLKSTYQASINTIRSLYSLVSDNNISNFGFMDREYLFTSTITCILFNSTFGIQEQSLDYIENSLKIFSKMKRLGNKPASLNLDQIINLLKLVDSNNLMNYLINKFSISSNVLNYDDNNENSKTLITIPLEPILDQIDIESVNLTERDIDLWNKISSDAQDWSNDLTGIESLLNNYT